MVRLTARQREALIEKMPDAANLVAGSMFFGQFLTDRPFSVGLAMLGAAGWAGFWIFTLLLAEDRRP